MISDIQKNKIDYSILALFSAIYLANILVFKSSNPQIFVSTVIYALFYVIWGIFHHLRDNSLRFKVMLEYVLVATLGIIVASSLLI